MNTPKMKEVRKFIDDLGVLETEEEREGFNQKWEEKLLKHPKRKAYAEEINEIYTQTWTNMQKAILIVGLIDKKGETVL